MLLQLKLKEKAHERESSLYASLNLLLKRLHDFAEAGNDPRDVRLADMEPDVEHRVYLIKKKLWELKNVDRTDITDSKSSRDMA
jgi:hypothetical protein